MEPDDLDMSSSVNPFPTQHPMEQVFDLEPGSTPTIGISGTVVAPSEATTTVRYDDKDAAIETELTTIHNEAMELVTSMKQTMAYGEPKGMARLGEVSIQALNTALDAIKQKADIKKHKDKMAQTGGVETVNNTINNTMIVDRGALLDRIMAGEL